MSSGIAPVTDMFASTLTRPVPRSPASANAGKPQPNGQPGSLRVDTVHQGDLDGGKGVYYINAVDEVTQFAIVCSVETIRVFSNPSMSLNSGPVMSE